MSNGIDRASAHQRIDAAFAFAPGAVNGVARSGVLAAHDVVDNLFDVIDLLAVRIVEQDLHPRRSTSPAPSNETEAELIEARKVAALESIAKSLAAFVDWSIPS